MNYSIICVFFICCIVGTFASGSDDLLKIDKKCAKDCKISAEELRRMDDLDLSKATDPMKCYIDCFMIAYGAMKNGKIDVLKLAELVQVDCDEEEPAKITERINSCKDEKGANSKEINFKITQCIYKDGFCASTEE